MELWWPKGNSADSAEAHRFASDIDGVIWRAFAGLLGRTPIRTPKGCVPSNDRKLQIVLAPVRSYTQQYGRQSPDGPFAVYIVLDPNASRDELAHELFHAFEDAFHYAGPANSDYRWFLEGAAAWAEYYAYPEDHG